MDKGRLAQLCVTWLLLVYGCSSDVGSSSVTPSPANISPGDPSAPPEARDNSEGLSGDDTTATASTITVGQSQLRTLFPAGDVDYVKVKLDAGLAYEISANRLSYTADTRLELYDANGALVASNDDYIKLDSRILFTPAANALYLIKVSGFNVSGVASYTLSVHLFSDADADTYSAYYDCNDRNNSVHPFAADPAGDGIDQNCNGLDSLVATTPDAAEPDDTIATAREMRRPSGSAGEIIFRQDIAANARTIHSVGQADYFFVKVPSKGAIEIDLAENNVSGANDLKATVYDSDGNQIATSVSWPYFFISNAGPTEKTYYIRYESSSGVDTGYYLPYYGTLGFDIDGDGYYDQDFADYRDCNEADPTVNPGAADTTVDGYDQNCDLVDGS